MGSSRKALDAFKSRKDNPDASIRHTLFEHGDDGTKPRPVDHFAYFNTQAEADAFATFLKSQDYSIGKSEEEFGVAFSKTASVASAEFDEELVFLREKAREFGGEYDGWGCSVVAD